MLSESSPTLTYCTKYRIYSPSKEKRKQSLTTSKLVGKTNEEA